MVQHLLLTMVAPPLLLLGAPITLALRTESRPRRAALARMLRSRTVHVLGNPLLGWMLFAGTLWASHLPAFYDATLRNVGLHAAEHLAYLSTALLFWRPLVGKDPGPVLSHPARLFAMFLIMPQMTFLGLAIYSSDRPLYAHYIATSLRFGTTAVGDQHLAGAIMWSSGMLFMVPAMALVLIDWMRKDERDAARFDARCCTPVAEVTICVCAYVTKGATMGAWCSAGRGGREPINVKGRWAGCAFAAVWCGWWRFDVRDALSVSSAAAAPATDLDTTFGPSGNGYWQATNGGWAPGEAVVQPDGKILVSGGVIDAESGIFNFVLYRLTQDGIPDTTFSGDGTRTFFSIGPEVRAGRHGVGAGGRQRSWRWAA